MPATPLVCTPNAIAAGMPCVQSLNGDNERWRMIVYCLWRLIYGPAATLDVNTLLQQANCFNCVSEGELLNNLVAVLAQTAVAEGALTELPTARNGHCLQCLNTLELKRIALYLGCASSNWTGN